MTRHLSKCFLVLCCGLMSALPAAALVTYEFTVTATEGPLMGTSSTGVLTYDESQFLLSGTYAGAGLLESVLFDWNGITFTEANVDTGSLTFDNSQLVGAQFGTKCFGASGCSISNPGDWVVHITAASGGSFTERWPSNAGGCGSFGVSDDCRGTVSLRPSVPGSVPEPATLALLTFGLAGFVASRRRRRS